jgi:hypothetical protein
VHVGLDQDGGVLGPELHHPAQCPAEEEALRGRESPDLLTPAVLLGAGGDLVKAAPAA